MVPFHRAGHIYSYMLHVYALIRTRKTYHLAAYHFVKFVKLDIKCESVCGLLCTTFPSEEAKEAFLSRLSAVRDLMMSEASAKVHNYNMLCSLLSLAENEGDDSQAASRRETELSTSATSCFFSVAVSSLHGQMSRLHVVA